MKIKKLLLIAGTLAIALTATPFVAQAQTDTNEPRQPREMVGKGPFRRLNLTDAQKEQMKKIHKSTRAKIEAVLTPEQRQKLEAAKAEMKARRKARRNGTQIGKGKERDKETVFSSLDLTDAQKREIRTIKESARTQMEAILTPEQKAKMEQFKQNMRSRRQQDRNFQ
ncbi:MAG: Spy/CpxP family protein refolding chaperone [Dolichospermum sp.]